VTWLGQARRTAAPSPTGHRPRRQPGSLRLRGQVFKECRLPTPGSPRISIARLSPARTGSFSRSSTSRSARHSARSGVRHNAGEAGRAARHQHVIHPNAACSG